MWPWSALITLQSSFLPRTSASPAKVVQHVWTRALLLAPLVSLRGATCFTIQPASRPIDDPARSKREPLSTIHRDVPCCLAGKAPSFATRKSHRPNASVCRTPARNRALCSTVRPPLPNPATYACEPRGRQKSELAMRSLHLRSLVGPECATPDQRTWLRAGFDIKCP